MQGRPIVIPDGEITAELQTISFQVNASSFKDGLLKVTIGLGGNDADVVDLYFDESLDCGIITPLPVELTRFEGKATESGIALEWATVSELNNSHFEIERSTDGERYTSIARQQGHGTTSTPATYNYTDKLPKNGTNYYRLKQVDYDNTYSYTKTLAIKWQAGDAIQLAMVPNPCRNGDCKIALTNAADRKTLLQLKDMAGRVIYSKTVTSDSHLFELPLNELGKYKGLYFLSATTDGQVIHQRILLE
ncbi:T9SS type A sorting domain-containing protein [Pontibacter sp. BT213]|uniref:T9SS type A sorting domain-containing protein n=1 Tax=Pontibacter fetidus TaxID=2700082 RepID=A0A6B2H5X1_9BACT|nr:T9SS type A sorting domain-containing protein [Pontibacter fetidus]